VYVNPLYPVEDLATVHAWLDERPFGTLIAPGPPPAVGHVPFVLDRGMGPSGGFRAHTPARDPISEQLATGAEVLAVFLGPLAYVSPDWYGEPAFGTYNFVAKLGQHRSAEDRRGVVAGLRATRADDGSAALADLMEGFPYASDDARPLLG
jgi:transcriptional regulator